ncbi:MAG: class I SAM-dependent methyltransferase, partial [Microcoleus sp. SIO2G3]|nr:class I SAM-dependent methyltransferase [Microcoleus sp. SIO2G3]
PLLKEAKIGTPESPILDIGCGRGEWLELLNETGYTAKGLDINRVMVDSCKARGFEVVEGEAISYLQNLPDVCLGAVTGFHVIEHLSFPVLKQFLGEVVRVLKPGGLVIFETPNPKNLVVGACNFYSDPTHQNPLFPDTIQFLVESQGLSDVQLLYLHPVEGSPFDKEDAGLQLLHTWFFCSRDYAVVGYKL